MQNKNETIESDPQYSAFEQYPWAGNHDNAINWLVNYMDENAEVIIKEFDERILKKVARDHSNLSGRLCIA